MDKHVIRTNETDSVRGLASTVSVDLNLRQTAKTLPFPNVSTTLSQRSVYEEERQAGNNFRLILTIVPYCSNVLFNPLTEIIKDEGSDNAKVVTDVTNMDNAPVKIDNKIDSTIGVDKPTRTHMICNTEYSSEMHGGYEYHPGYDFFDNHLLRNLSFKLVNPFNGNVKDAKEVFNTLGDYARDRNGEVKKYNRRISINSINTKQGFNKDKHLYLIDDVMKIEDSINNNLYDENGWWGFTNNTTIDTKKLNNRRWDSMDIGKALNNHKACEFIDMYPDRSLFSFTPKFNKFTHKNENNWNVVLTYPYKNIYDHPLCMGGTSYIKRTFNSEGEFVEETVSEGNRWMGLKVLTVQSGSGKAGSNSLIFRTYTKHGLEQGDLFYLYYTNPYKETAEDEYGKCEKFSDKTLNGSEVYYESQSYYKVSHIGDLSKNNNDYFFYTSSISLVREIYKSYLKYVEKLIKDKVDTSMIPFYEDYKNDDKKDVYDADNNLKTVLINKILKYSNFRIRRCVKGVKSTYYIRQFRKIPNLRAAQREMTDEEALHRSKFNGVFDSYVADNALDPINPNYQRNFNNEMYQLGFASSIYNDNVTQITFMDGINVKGLTDNLGRPLTEIYYTIVKNNAGHEVWYHNEEPFYSNEELRKKYKDNKEGFKEKYGADYDGYSIEFSHCFGKVTSGFETFVMSEDTENTTAPSEYWKKLSSVHHISNIINNGINGDATPIYKDEDSRMLDKDVKYTNTFFYGDLVEFNAVDFTEKTISKVMHRFNTAQRETENNPYYSQYQYHEIVEDDYDPQYKEGTDPFDIKEFSAVNGIQDGDTSKPMTTDFTKRKTDYATISRPEGYYYQAHYPIQIREYTQVLQGSHYTLRVRMAKPVQREGILIQVKTYIAHNLNTNDIIFICDDESDIRYITRCVKVIDRTTFLMSPNYEEYIINATDFEDKEYVSNIEDSVRNPETGLKNVKKYKKRFSWLELCHILNGKFSGDINYPKLVLRRKDSEIPDYATYIGGNQYLWRDIINIGDTRAKNIKDYIFANGYFYVTQSINFFLKRQDPFGNSGLYFDGEDKYPFFPNDPTGVQQKENNYILKETSTSC